MYDWTIPSNGKSIYIYRSLFQNTFLFLIIYDTRLTIGIPGIFVFIFYRTLWLKYPKALLTRDNGLIMGASKGIQLANKCCLGAGTVLKSKSIDVNIKVKMYKFPTWLRYMGTKKERGSKIRQFWKKSSKTNFWLIFWSTDRGMETVEHTTT